MRLLSVLLLLGLAHAQEGGAAQAPPLPRDNYPHVARSVTPFWNRGNTLLVTSFLVLQGSDAWATEHNWRSHPNAVERNPLIPGSRMGRVAYFSGTAAGTLGAAWLAHKTGHRKIARAILWLGNAVEVEANVTSWGEF